jgi:hypothetical protein
MNELRFTLHDRYPVIVKIDRGLAGQWSVEFHGPSISSTGYYSNFAGSMPKDKSAQPTESDLKGLEIWAKAKADNLHKVYALERAKQFKTWPLKYAGNVELQVGELFHCAWPISWVEFNQEWHFWVWDLNEVRIIALNRKDDYIDQSLYLPARNLVGAWRDEGYVVDYGKKSQRTLLDISEVKGKASKSKVKVAAPAPVVEVTDYCGITIINRLGSVTVNHNGQRLGRLSWLRERDLSGPSDLIKIALAAHIEQHKSSEAFTLAYDEGNHAWRFTRP